MSHELGTCKWGGKPHAYEDTCMGWKPISEQIAAAANMERAKDAGQAGMGMLTPRPVATQLERIERGLEAVLAALANADELYWSNYWTRLEAVIKGQSDGIGQELLALRTEFKRCAMLAGWRGARPKRPKQRNRSRKP